MGQFISHTAVILPIATDKFQVFGGEDLIKECSTIEEAEYWKGAYEQHHLEFIESVKNGFYKSKSTNKRMIILNSYTNPKGTVMFNCKVFNNGENAIYLTLDSVGIESNFEIITFIK